MEIVTKKIYLTRDGLPFLKREDAEDHEARLDTDKLVNIIWSDWHSNTQMTKDDLRTAIRIALTEIKDFCSRDPGAKPAQPEKSD